MLKISVILPCRDEEKNIPRIIPALINHYKKYIYEIIIVDDCSLDRTEIVVKSLQKKYHHIRFFKRTTNPGVGNALKVGIKHVSIASDAILFMDCDFIANIRDIGKMIAALSHTDGVVGSRFLHKISLINYPFVKLIANRTYHFLINSLLGFPHKDLTNNLKLYKKDLVTKITPFLQSHDFAINAELGYFPLLIGSKITEVPVVWKERTAKMGLSKFKILLVGPSYLRVFIRLLLYSTFRNRLVQSVSTRV